MKESREGIIESYLKEGAALRLLALTLRKEIAQAADLIPEAFQSGGKHVLSFVLGAAVIPAFAVLVLAASGTLGDFWTETISRQTIRFPQTTFEKTWGLFNYFGWVSRSWRR